MSGSANRTKGCRASVKQKSFALAFDITRQRLRTHCAATNGGTCAAANENLTKTKAPKKTLIPSGLFNICKINSFADFHFGRILSGRDALRLLTTLAEPNAERSGFPLLARYGQRGPKRRKEASSLRSLRLMLKKLCKKNNFKELSFFQNLTKIGIFYHIINILNHLYA